MNILKRKFFIVIAITLCSLYACIDVDKTMGLDYVPDSQWLKVAVHEFTVPIYTEALDSICTSSTSVGSIGYMINDPFGLFYSGAVFRMVPYINTLSYPTGAILDSAILYIPIGNKIAVGGEGKMSQMFYLYSLNRDLGAGTYYYNNSLKTTDYNPVPVAEPFEYKGEDTLKIRLTTAYAQALLNATEEEMTNDTLFMQTFRGLYLAVDTTATPVGLQGGRVAYFNHSSAWLTTYYHESVENDSTLYCLYVINPDVSNFNVFKHSSTHLAGNSPSSTIYLEGLAGVKPYIDFNLVKAEIQNMLNGLGVAPSKLLINRLELIVETDYPTYTMDNYPPLTTLTYKVDTSVFLFNFLVDTYFGQFNGQLNRSIQQYSYNPTYFSQGLFTPHVHDNSAEAQHLYIYPLYTTYDYYGQTVYLMERTNYSFGVLKGPNAKIKLTYTILP